MRVAKVKYIYSKKIRVDVDSFKYRGSFNGDLKKATHINVMEMFADYVFKHPKPVLYDIGACTGSYTLLGKLHKKMFTYAFEPVPESFKCLKNNVTINRLNSRTKLYNFAVSNFNGTAGFNITKQDYNKCLSMLGGKPQYYKDCYQVETKVVTLDKFYQKPPTAIKIDVEGNELNVLKGMKGILEKYHPIILCEVSHENTVQYGYDPEKTVRYLKRLGYKIQHTRVDIIASYESNISGG